ncbi:MAG TPA: cupredoxin domain-containing protein, partial [Gaiellaceae bacterium]
MAVVGVARNPAATVHVTVGGGHCVLSQNTVPVGPVTFVVSNRGSSSDDFVVDGSRTRLLRPGRTATLKVDFAKAGSYGYRCTVAKRGGR